MRRKPSRRMTDIGGMALAEFQLARRGIEFARTQPGSPSGDIWAELPCGRLSIEVKSTFAADGWHIKRGQTGGDFYFLVQLETCRTYILQAADLKAIAEDAPDIFAGVALVKRNALPSSSLEAWATLGLHRMPGLQREPIVYTSTRRVRRTLTNGKIKVYTYPGTNKQTDLQITNAGLSD